jgi:hypothetical protein
MMRYFRDWSKNRRTLIGNICLIIGAVLTVLYIFYRQIYLVCAGVFVCILALVISLSGETKKYRFEEILLNRLTPWARKHPILLAALVFLLSFLVILLVSAAYGKAIFALYLSPMWAVGFIVAAIIFWYVSRRLQE